MTQSDASKRESGQTMRLTRARAVTRLSLSVERLWPLLLPAVLVVSLYLCISWLGVFRVVGSWPGIVLGALCLLGAIVALVPLRLYRAPTRAEVDRRVESANALAHEPLSVQADQPSAGTDGFGEALWREHQRRMAARLAGVGSDLPRTGIPKRDPWGARAVVALLLVVAFAFSFGPRGGSVTDVFRGAPAIVPLPPRIDAWVTPPPYTGKAPIFLTAETNQKTAIFTVPAGSDIALRITGGSGDETATFQTAEGVSRNLSPAIPAAPAGASPKGSPTASRTDAGTGGAPLQFADKLREDGDLALVQGGRDLAHWTFSVTPDRPPTIRFTQEPTKAANGALELHYAVVDDYGAKSAKSEFALAEPKPNAHPLYGPPEMPIALPRRGAKDSAAKANRDLTEHVWAGSTVQLTLSATDDAGQEAKTETKTIVLPERIFTNPLARALLEFRKILALDTNEKKRVVDLIDAISLRPEDTFDNPSHYLGLMAGLSRLKLSQTDDQLRDVADYFWNMALQVEDGDLSTAQKRLAKAQEALKQALRNGASDEEIDKLMKELREAMADFMREFAERAARDPSMAQQQQQPGQELRESDLQKMMDQIENLAKSGDREKAEDLLSQLQDMMNNLQAQRQQPGQNGQQGEMRKQMNKLGEIMRRQQEMMNETFQLDKQQRGQQGDDQFGDGDQDGQQDQGQQGQPGQQGRQGDKGMTPQEFADALKQLQQGQGKLQGDLSQLMEGLQGMGIQPGKGFGEAGDAMGEAKGALGESDGNRAVGQQGRALDALRRGAKDMMQQMQQAMQGDQGGGEEGGRQQNADRDPLGRPRATTGPDFGNSVKVPDEIDIQRARQILEAIRKRLGNTLSPDLERSYLERLLDMR